MGYELKSARYLARETILQAVCPGDTAVGATMGNGHDTRMLCEAVGTEGRVYAFDVQEQALEETRKRLQEHGMAERAVLLCTGHEHMAEYVRESVKAVMFNLGWLPGGDHRVTTRWETTKQAVESALELLALMGVLVICVYPGHAEGEREAGELAGLLSGLSNREYNVLHQRFLNATAGAPECFIVQKQRIQP